MKKGELETLTRMELPALASFNGVQSLRLSKVSVGLYAHCSPSDKNPGNK